MLIHLNGFPGVGKLAVARSLAEMLDGRVLDNHSVCNVAFSLFDFGTPPFFEAVRAIRTVAYDRARSLGAEVPLVLTNVLTDSEIGNEFWQEMRQLADDRGSAFFAVTLSCEREENLSRLTSPERALLHKLTDRELATAQMETTTLVEAGADRLLRLDTTWLTPIQAAATIFAWISDA